MGLGSGKDDSPGKREVRNPRIVRCHNKTKQRSGGDMGRVSETCNSKLDLTLKVTIWGLERWLSR